MTSAQMFSREVPDRRKTRIDTMSPVGTEEGRATVQGLLLNLSHWVVLAGAGGV